MRKACIILSRIARYSAVHNDFTVPPIASVSYVPAVVSLACQPLGGGAGKLDYRPYLPAAILFPASRVLGYEEYIRLEYSLGLPAMALRGASNDT